VITQTDETRAWVTDLVRELVRALDLDEEAVGHTLLQGRTHVVLGEGDARLVGNDRLLDGSGRRTGAVLEALDRLDAHLEVGRHLMQHMSQVKVLEMIRCRRNMRTFHRW